MANEHATVLAACACACLVGILSGLGVAVPVVAALPYDPVPSPPSHPPMPPDPPSPPAPPSKPPPPSPISPLAFAGCSEATLEAHASGLPSTWEACQRGSALYGVSDAVAVEEAADGSGLSVPIAVAPPPETRGVCALCTVDTSLTFYTDLDAIGMNATQFCLALDKEQCKCVCPPEVAPP